jgi:putative transcriptional regulator
LLVSATELVEPTFRRTVIYIVEHNDAGSLGVVLNRPSETAVQDVLPRWADLAAGPRTLYVGGPVKRDSALCLTTVRVGASIEGIRIFAGYAGWTFGQLEGELERGDWIVLSALPSDPLAGRTDLWAHVLRRQPLPLSLLATHPIELERN